jgi:hypothetical protein
MKKLISLLAFCAILATLALPAFAQTQPSSSSTPQEQTNEEAKAALYKKFTDNIKTNQDVAYQAGQEYLQKYSAEDDYTKYIKRWVTAYDAQKASAAKDEVQKKIDAKDYNGAFALGKQLLAKDPNDLLTLNRLAIAGWFAAIPPTNNEANNADAIRYGKQAIQLIQQGKTFVEGQPIEKKDEVLGWLNYSLGFLNRKSNPTEAANHYVKAAQLEGPPKKDPQLYDLLARAYEEGAYKKMLDDYKARFPTDEQKASPEGMAANEKIKQMTDLLIDAYARAVAYATDPKFAAAKTEWRNQLAAYYKYRNNGSDTGLDQLISGVTAKPIPTPDSINNAPATAPATTGSTSTTPPATQPAGTTTTTPGTTTAQPTTKPATTTQPKTTSNTGTTSRPRKR